MEYQNFENKQCHKIISKNIESSSLYPSWPYFVVAQISHPYIKTGTMYVW